MSALPQVRAISELQKSYTGLLADLVNGPVYLLQRQTVAAVMVAPDEWDRVQKELQQARRDHLAMLMSRRDDPADAFVSLDDAIAGMPS